MNGDIEKLLDKLSNIAKVLNKREIKREGIKIEITGMYNTDKNNNKPIDIRFLYEYNNNKISIPLYIEKLDSDIIALTNNLREENGRIFIRIDKNKYDAIINTINELLKQGYKGRELRRILKTRYRYLITLKPYHFIDWEE